MTKISRRTALFASAALIMAPKALLAAAEPLPAPPSRRSNPSGFTMIDWREHFDKIGKGIIIADIASRAVHYWGSDQGNYHLYPSSIPISEELTKRGYTEIMRKRVGPDWTPTADMRRRDPSLPPYLPPGPENPLGTHAMYLTWPAYLIHGTHDSRKIGRASSSGCIGLYNEHIADLYSRAVVGTRVLLL